MLAARLEVAASVARLLSVTGGIDYFFIFFFLFEPILLSPTKAEGSSALTKALWHAHTRG